ncbi:MAG: glycosyltransferase family 2 protein [Ruminococcus sp.]|nr:glycosyltransferase family 2 protein [Ruminococcus sp.]
MLNPLVSVVIPIYNVEDYLDKCIESVVCQTYSNLEIILVDDGATDSCPQICDKWSIKDSRIKVVHKKNAGLGMARNTGIDNANGDYILFFDSDDTVDKDTVRKCLDCAEATGASVVAFYGCDVFDDGRVIKKDIPDCKRVFVGEEVQNEFLPGLFSYTFGLGVSSCMKMFNLKVLKASSVRFKSEREIISEDAFFAMEFFSEVSVAAILPECLYYYYKRCNSLTKTYKADRMQKNNIFLSRCLDCIREKHLPAKVSHHITVRYHLYSFEAMKQIQMSDLPKSEKKEKLLKAFSDEVLLSTLNKEVLSLHSKSLRLFFSLLKLRMYGICRLLIKIKVKG